MNETDVKTGRTPALWLALHFPHLGLDLISRGHGSDASLAIAVSDNDARRPAIIDCNPTAMRAGIKPGLPVNAALGLLDSLRVEARDPYQEQQALQRLAACCYQYSSEVSIIGDRSTVLLETAASHRLFGDTQTMAGELCTRLLQLGYHTQAGSAPTPEGAHLASRYGLHINRSDKIPMAIAKLPLDALHLDKRDIHSFEKMGFRTIAEVLRLPRKALARRQGPGISCYLDRLLGARPDPQKPWRPPEQFRSGIDLAPEVSNNQALLFPIKRLLGELCAVLRGGDQGVQELEVLMLLDQRRKEPGRECLRLHLQQPVRCESHLLLLVRERLERLHLCAPVRHIRLQARQLLPFDPGQAGIFRDDPAHDPQPIAPLLERLQARLGKSAVQGLKGHQDHRPEHSWAVRELNEPSPCTAMPHRPVWLFPQPQPCHINDYQVIAGPERIEAGWWDGHDCRRDYFVVLDRSGSTLWAYREYKPEPGWYLQGFFS